MNHEQRLEIHQVDPEAYGPMYAMEKYVHSGTLGEPLLSLVKMRASQLNGCARCLDMHAREARSAGVDQRVLDVLAGWREAPSLFTERERAAIELAEEVTLIGEHGVTDRVWGQVVAAFSEKETVELLMAISAINVWNRLAVSTHQSLSRMSQP